MLSLQGGTSPCRAIGIAPNRSLPTVVAAQRAPISFLIGLSVVLFALSPKVVYSDPIDIRAAPPTQAGPPAGTGNIAQVVRDHSIAVIAQGSVTINYTTQEQDAKLRSSQTVLRQE